ncbi:unnamed protein product [Fraxinus pennsylvanica]|uniref:Glycine-rich protein n=1 Tax=Fraxinus pennsylvanica TaxID=56036 RepID=A0AAD2EEK4_9LAMI|nr:unnamed protein product [Fraxinus pennsylvanica]
MNSATTFILLAFLLFSPTLSFAILLPKPSSKKPIYDHPSSTNSKKGRRGGNNDDEIGGFFGPGVGFDIPGFNTDWGKGVIGGGYGVGYGGPGGGYSEGGTIRRTVVCQEKGPCYKKKLRCPDKCFTSFSGSGKGSGYG